MSSRPWTAFAAACAILAVLTTGTGAFGSADTQAAASPRPLDIYKCSTAQLSDIMAVYLPASAMEAKTTPTPAPDAQSYLRYILRKRLAQCWAQLGGHTPHPKVPITPGDACWPLNDEQVPELWTHLKFCESLLGPPAKAPPGIDWHLPATSGTGNRPVIFVVGVGDPAMVGRLVSALVTFLNEGREEAGYQFVNDAILIPEPSWSLENYVTQCANSPSVQGAIVVDVTASGGGTTDQFIARKNWTAIQATSLYAECRHTAGASQGASSFVWASDIVNKEGKHLTLTPLTPLAMLLTMAAIYEVFAPARVTSTASTKALPNPSPIPSGGRVTQVVTTDQTTLNASTLGTVAGGFLGSSITYTNSAIPISQQPVDELTWDTLQSIAIALMSQMNCWHPAPGPSEESIATIVGAKRTLPPYTRPNGLASYSSGKTTAPFCSEPGASESINDILPATPTPEPMPTRTPHH